MGVTRKLAPVLVLGTLAALGGSAAIRAADDSQAIMRKHADEDAAERAARWKELAHAIFGARSVQDGAAVIQIQAPEHALDAALVPITLTMKSATPIKSLY